MGLVPQRKLKWETMLSKQLEQEWEWICPQKLTQNSVETIGKDLWMKRLKIWEEFTIRILKASHSIKLRVATVKLLNSVISKYWPSVTVQFLLLLQQQPRWHFPSPSIERAFI